MRNEIKTSAGEVNQKAIFMIGNVQNKKILDAGCGSGEISNYYSKQNNVLGIDIKNKLDYGIPFLVADLNKELFLKKEFYDIIFCIEVLDALENYRNALRELKRVLKKNGKLVVSFCNLHCFKSRVSLFLKGKLFGYQDKDYFLAGHRQPIPFNIFQHVCNEEGLLVRRKTFCNNKEILLLEIIKRKEND